MTEEMAPSGAQSDADARTPTALAGKVCLNCEWADPGGDRSIVKTVDCHNPRSPRFTPEWNFSCSQWWPDTSDDGSAERVAAQTDRLTREEH